MSLQPTLPAASLDQSAPNTANGPLLQPGPAGNTNGAPLPTPGGLPRARRGKKSSRLLLPAAALVVVLSAGGVWGIWFRGSSARTDLVTRKVEYRDIRLKIVERGSLEAKEPRDVKCEVKTGSRGAPKIKWVVENGTYVKGPELWTLLDTWPIMVKQGELLVDIDDSYLQEQATDQKITRDKAETEKISAELLYPSKKTAIALAEKNLDKWIKGDFPQSLHDLEGQIQTSESNLLQEEDRMAWVARMVKKNYMTASQEEAERALLMGNKLDLQKKQELKKVLTDYTNHTNIQDLENKILDAKNQERTAHSDMLIKRAIFEQQDTKYNDFLEQIKQCKVYAQYSGIVVYAVPEQTMRGSGSNQSIIAQGEPVQYGQKMMSIPDLSHMLVNLRIHEALINYVKSKQEVEVQVPAVPGKTLNGRVKSVANVANPPDWSSPDVKVYQAYVEILESVEHLKLKPGLSAACTIYTDVRVDHVLAVPVEAVLSPLEKGGKPKCYVRTPSGTEAREVETGLSDNIYVEVKSGLNEGDEVVLNPRSLLSDKEKTSKQDEKNAPPGGKGGPGGGKGKGKMGDPVTNPPADRK